MNLLKLCKTANIVVLIFTICRKYQYFDRSIWQYHNISWYWSLPEVFCNISWHWSSPQWLSPQPRFIWLHHGAARLANELLIVMNIEQAAVGEDTHHFGGSSHQSSLLKLGSDGSIAQAITQNTRGKVLFLSVDCVCIGLTLCGSNNSKHPIKGGINNRYW